MNSLELNKHDKKLMEEIRKVCGYSSLENFKKPLKDEDKDIANLDGFLKVVKLLFPDNHIKLIEEFALTLNPDTITIRLLLETATLFGHSELKLQIIERLKASSKAESKEWAYIYEVDHLIATRQIGFFDGLNMINSKKYSKPETKAYSKIAQIYCYYDMRNIHMVKFSLDEVENDIKEIKNKFLKTCYTSRMFGMKVDMNLHNEEIGKLIENLFTIENAPSPVRANIYLQIGNSYMVKSYEKSIKYLMMAKDIATPNILKEVISSLNFVNLLWNRPENYIMGDTISNELFYYIRKGNKSEAMRTLNKINFEELSDHAKAFNCYYQGLLHNDKSYFYKSIEYFNKVGEKFYKQIPLMELQRNGENELVLKALGA